MLGSSLLVAPVFRSDDIAEYYLPAGRWTHLLTGEPIEGGTWHRQKLDFMSLPLFVRENGIIPMSSNIERGQWSLRDELTLHLFSIAEGSDLSLRVAASDGHSSANFRCRREGGLVTIEGDSRATQIRVYLSSKQPFEITNGRLIAYPHNGILVSWSNVNKPLELKMAE